MNVADSSRMQGRTWILATLILVAALTLRWIDLGAIRELIFDEAHYVPAAEVLVGLKEHPGMGAWASHPLLGKAPAPNFEHPLLGKFLIGFGLKLFAEPFFGARFFPALAGSLSLLLMALLARRFFGRTFPMLLALLFLGFDSMAVLHSRLAMLDIFLMTSLIGLLHSTWQLIEKPQHWGWRLSSALWITAGLSSKWVFAFAILGFCWCLLAMGRGRFRLRVNTLVIVGLTSLGLYHLWFLYYAAHGFSYAEWLEFHVAANAVTTGKLAQHPYGATAFSMLVNSRNIWYYFKQIPEQLTVGLVGLLNPLLLFSCLPALLLIACHYAMKRRREDLFILGWFACCYLPFHLVLMERQGFLYYMLLVLPIIILAVIRTLDLIDQLLRVKLVPWVYAGLFLLVSGFYMPVVMAWPMSRDFYLFLIRFTGV